MESKRINRIALVSFIIIIGLAKFGNFNKKSNNESEINTDSRNAINFNGNSSREPGRYQELGKLTQIVKEVKNEQSVVFNDPAMVSKWDLEKTDALKAWSISQGSRQIVVAVIDTGCDVNHEDLKSNIWNNPGETGLDPIGKNKSNNGVDDDENGFVDDIHGWNFVSTNNKLDDNHGHGTHVAGILGAEGGNTRGISGIAPKVSIMCLKYYDPSTPTDNLKNTIAAIKYVQKLNTLWEKRRQPFRIHIVNYSGGGLEYSQDEKDSIKTLEAQGVLFVAAAGNEKSNSDRKKYYPADYGLSNIISVTAIDPNEQVLASSNYGVETVDIAAPGQAILSTLPNNSYGLLTGTSQATAFVSGAASVVMAHKGNFSATDVKKYLLSTGDSQISLLNKTGTSRKLNLYKALTLFDSGEGVTGVKAGNLTDAQRFSPDSELFKATSSASGIPGQLNTDSRSPSNNTMNQFGKNLMDSVKKGSGTEEIDFASKKPVQ